MILINQFVHIVLITAYDFFFFGEACILCQIS